MPQPNNLSEMLAIGEALPTLKRKRKSEGYLEQVAAVNADAETKTCFTNAAFSSTPKKAVARRRTPASVPHNFIQNPCLEIKSIADVISNAAAHNNANTEDTDTPTKNPFEVVRKPPKKKKRETELNEACFENPALNLELPEKTFNPYEVVRALPSQQTQDAQTNCFVNPALNLRTKDDSTTRNPFEIRRCANIPQTVPNIGVENPALEEATAVEHTDLRIALPFKPTVGCRIDFSKIPIEQLTPSKLLADKLVFSPVLAVPKRSLDSASEESSMDIGRELDRYQLELENSINEAKIRKNLDTYAMEVKTEELTVQVEVEQRITFTQRLEEIVEEDEDKENECLGEEVQCTTTTTQQLGAAGQQQMAAVVNNKFEILREAANEDVAYASNSDDEDELDLKAPTPFVRAYQRSAPLKSQSAGSKESLKSTGSVDSNEHKKSLNVRNIIRKSIRKLMHPKKHNEYDAEIVEEDAEKKDECLEAEEALLETPEQPQMTTGANKQFEVLREPAKEDVAYASASDDEDELDFKAPAPFVRAYQRAAPLKSQSAGSKESLQSTGSADSNQHKKSLNVRNIIRKSIRKLMHPNKNNENGETKNDVEPKEELLSENGFLKEKESQHISAYKLIRNSLRRKAPTKTMPSNEQQMPLAKAEISIIDTSERTMKLKAELLPRSEDERNKHTLRHNLRRSTREMGQHFMKSVFHKNQEAYDFRK